MLTESELEHELEALDQALAAAFRSGRPEGLELLGYGEISCTVAVSCAGGRYACKRLPEFDGEERYETYRLSFERYLEALAARGVRPVRSMLAALRPTKGKVVAYCVQPALPAGSLVPALLATLSEQEAFQLIARVVEAIHCVVGPAVGLDGQISNWALVDGELEYLDLTTPMLRDEKGRDALDADLFLASAPWAARPLLKRFLLKGILDKYHSPRGVLLDLLGNLYKERLEPLIPPLLEQLAPILTPPLTEQEVRKYYRDDARVWALWQRLRRMDRFWQRRVRRRAYPFLLPERIERHV